MRSTGPALPTVKTYASLRAPTLVGQTVSGCRRSLLGIVEDDPAISPIVKAAVNWSGCVGLKEAVEGVLIRLVAG